MHITEDALLMDHKMMNANREAFFDAHALEPWAEGSEAVCAKSVDGRKPYRIPV
jgi:hypothetical protein